MTSVQPYRRSTIHSNLWLLGLALGIFITSCKSRLTPTYVSGELKQFDTSVVLHSAEIDAIITPYRNELELTMTDTVGYLARAMVKSRPEGLLGNLTSKMVFDYARTIEPELDMVVMNHGGLRTPLPSGVITRSKVFELMPFDNELAIVDLPIERLPELARIIAVKGGDPIWIRDEGYLQIGDSSGTFHFPLREGQKMIRIATSNYLSNGGDHYTVFRSAPEHGGQIRLQGILIRDIFMNAFINDSDKDHPLDADINNIIRSGNE